MAGNIKGQESPHVSKSRHGASRKSLSESQVWIPLESLAAASLAVHCAYPHRTVSIHLPVPPQRLCDARSRRCNFGDRVRIERFRRLGNGTRTGETLTPGVGRPTHRPAAPVAQRPPQLNARCRCSTGFGFYALMGGEGSSRSVFDPVGCRESVAGDVAMDNRRACIAPGRRSAVGDNSGSARPRSSGVAPPVDRCSCARSGAVWA